MLSFGFRFLSLWPLWALQALGHGLGWLAWLFSPTYRRRFLANSGQAGLTFWQQWRAAGHAGCLITELPRLWLGRLPRVNWVQPDRIQETYTSGRGVIYLTPHMGCFEITAQAVAVQLAPQWGPLTVLYRPARRAALDALMRASRMRPGLRPVATNLAGVRELLKALREGRAVGLLPDQVPPLGLGVWAPFFGQPAYTMTLAARLAQQTGVPVLLVWAERLSWGRGFRIHSRDLPAKLSPDLPTAVAQINQAMEALIRSAPEQYLWGYHRYREPRQESL